ncbi:MAG: prepilin-type N-terminal cleavage/methylation domain-containing protein [Nitrospirota bacterium]
MTAVNVYLNNKGLFHSSKAFMPFSNGKGFTLIESMVSMLILMVVVLGMIQTMIYVNAINLKNSVRGEAMKIGQQDFDNQTRLVRPSTALSTIILSTTAPVQIVKRFNNRDVTFYLCRYVTPRGNSVQVSVSVIWQLGDVVATAADPAGYTCFSTMTNSGYTGSYNAETIISPLVGS